MSDALDLDDEAADHVAIVGMAGRFPGAESVSKFWDNLLAGRDTIDRFDEGAGPRDPSRVYAAGVLPDAEDFDAELFGMNRAEATVSDPQHRVLLTCAWEALEAAGYSPRGPKPLTGVYVGCGRNTHRERVLEVPGLAATVGGRPLEMNNDVFRLPTLISYRLDLRGPSMFVQTACSTSLVAVHLAARGLLTGECDLALAGGVTVHFPQRSGYRYEEGGIESPDGRCRPFDAASAGTVFGNGAGIVVLRRLEDALADGDPIVAVLRGTAVNNDGFDKVGYTAPGVNGQVRVIREALAAAGLDARDIGYLEAHGTATELGDQVEVRAATEAFRHDTDDVGYCRLGSVKGNVGHLDTAAGIAGLIKAALVVREGRVPGSPHVGQPNPDLELERTPFRLATEHEEWPATDTPRRAAVSSFGIGGSNAHVILEEPPPRAPKPSRRQWQLLTWSAAHDDDAAALGERLATALGQLPVGDPAFADTAATTRTGRTPLRWRGAVVAADGQTAARLITARKAQDSRGEAQDRGAAGVAFLFPGQGAQSCGMATTPYDRHAEFRRWFDEGLAALEATTADELRRLLVDESGRGYTEADSELLESTELSQCALFLTEYALARQWQHWGLAPVGMLGHSVGEFVAACLAGVFDLPTAVRLVSRRGQLMSALPPGAMLAVPMSEDASREVLAESHRDAGVAVAAVNGPGRVVLSGPLDAIADVAKDFNGRGVAARRLRTRHAFHSPAVDAVLPSFQATVAQAGPAAPHTPFVSGVTGRWITGQQAVDPAYWASHLREPVRFADGVAELLGARPAVLLEVGPGRTLVTPARTVAGAGGPTVVGSLSGASAHDERNERNERDEKALATAAGAVWCAGVDLDWARFEEEPRNRRELPTYPFRAASHALPTVAVDGTRTRPDYEPQEPTVETVAESIEEPSGVDPRRDDVRNLFAEVLLVQPDDITDELTFIELGADSLTLLQASSMLRQRFGLQVPFRALMEQHRTVRDVADLLPTRPERPAPSQAAVATPVADGPGPLLPPGAAGATEGMVALFREQMALMNAQVAALSVQAGEAGRPAGQVAAASSNGREEDAAPPLARPDQTVPSPARQQPSRAYVPFRPLAPAAGEQLGDAGRRHVADLAGRLARSHPRTRELASTHRARLADERASARFRSLWKEAQFSLHFSHADGAVVHDVDGNRYVDLSMGFGALLFGHTPEHVLEAVRRQSERGLGLGLASGDAGTAAQLVHELTGMERVAFAGSGTDAISVAIRLARAETGRTRIVTFGGAYHGTNDQTLVRATGTNPPTTGPIAPGIATGTDTTVLRYGHEESLAYLREHVADLAAVVIEPVQSRDPALRPREFVREVARLTRAAGTALILDEVVTGFRVHPGGVRAQWDVDADMCVYGKVAGGGLPLGVVAGSARFLDAVDGGGWEYGDDSFPVANTTYVAGTFLRHPMLMPAVVANLTRLREEGPSLQEKLALRAEGLVRRINDVLETAGAGIRAVGYSSWFVFEFEAAVPYPDLFFLELLDRGVYIWEGRICYLSTAHTDDDLNTLVTAVRGAATALVAAGLGGQHLTELVATGAPNAGGPLPLTEGQSEMWALANLDPESAAANHLAMAIRIRATVDVEALEVTWRTVVARHGALRTWVDPLGERQHTDPHVDASVEVVDAHDVGVSTDEELRQWCAALVAVPIDPAHAPMARLTLLRLGSKDHVLVLRAHHLVVDGTSIGVLAEEVSRLYGKAAGGAPHEGATVALSAARSYGAYVTERLARTDALTAGQNYWKDQHTGQDVWELPTDRPRSAIRGFGAERVTVPLPSGVRDAVLTASRTLGATPTAVLLAGYVAVLRAVTGADSVVVGAFADDRLAAAAPGPLVANAVSVLPLRVAAAPSASFADVVAATRRALADGYDHRDYSLRRLQIDLGLTGDTSKPPLVATTFNVDAATDLDFAGVTGEVVSAPAGSIGVELAWNVVSRPDGYVVECDFNRDLFDPATVSSWIEHYGEVLVSGDARPAASVPTPAAPERAEQAYRMLDRGLTTARDEVVLQSGVTQLTGAALSGAADRIAAALAANGVRPGDLVGLSVKRGVGLVAAVAGIWRAGAAYLPLDRELPPERLEFMIEDSGVQVILADVGGADLGVGDGVTVDVAGLLRGPSRAAPVPDRPGPDRLAYVMYTSGSTGRPKGIGVPHSAVGNFVRAIAASPGLTGTDVLLAVTTFSFDISVLELLAPLCVGARVVIASEEQVNAPQALQSELGRHQATVMQATPATWRMLVDAGWDGRHGMRVLSGGEALPGSLGRALRERAAEVWNLYGPTECTVWATRHRLDDAPSGVVPIGTPLENATADVLDAGGRVCQVSVPGELHLGGTPVAWGYLGRPGLTAERFRPDPFAAVPGARRYATGDIVRRHASGSLEFVGRRDDQVKLRGYRIELGEIQNVLEEHPTIGTCVAGIRADSLVAWLVPTGGDTPGVTELRAFCRQRLPKYMVPAAFVSVPDLPLTPIGKVDRARLPDPDGARPSVESVWVAPRDDLERTLATAWSDVLAVEAVGVHDDFFELGGDSIRAITIATRVRKAGVAVTPQEVLLAATVEGLAEITRQREPAAPPERTVDVGIPAGLDLDRLAARISGGAKGGLG